MKKKILITGSSGFIGSFLVEYALDHQYEVYAGVRASSSRQFLSNKEIKLFTMDFSDQGKLSEILKQGPQFDYVVHNAGITKTSKKEEYSLVNFQYTKNFINALIEAGKVPEKFVLVSSLTSFGPGNPDTLEDIKDSDKPGPITAYGKSKLEAETYLKGLKDFPYLIFRPTAVYGPREKDLYLYFKIINRNLETYIGKPIPYLTFIYVKDLVRAIFTGIESSHVNKSYFVTDGNVYSGKTLAEIVKKHLNKKTLLLTVPLPVVRSIASVLEFFYGFAGKTPILNYEKINELSVVSWKCDVTPLKNDLNFTAEYNLERGLYEAIEWYKREKWL